MDTKFKAPGYEVGWLDPSADINSEGRATYGGQQPADGTLVHHTYYMSTIPGHDLPHAWVTRDDRTVALRDILDLDLLTLFVENTSEKRMDDDSVKVAIVGQYGWRAKTGQWERYRGVERSGGVLVRPDGIVAWRGSLAQARDEGWTRLVDRILKVV